MKQIIYISLFLLSFLSFGQEKNIKTKTNKGFVFSDYMIPAQVEVSAKGNDI